MTNKIKNVRNGGSDNNFGYTPAKPGRTEPGGIATGGYKPPSSDATTPVDPPPKKP